MAAVQTVRIKLKSYDHTLIDQAAEKIVETAKRFGATVSGPIPLPTDREIVTILRAVHKRLIDLIKPEDKVIEAIMSLELPAGVEISVKS